MEQFIEGVSSSNVVKGRRSSFPWGVVLIVGTLVLGGIFFYKKYQSTPPLLENSHPQRQHRPPPPPSRHSMGAHQAYADMQNEMGNGASNMRSTRKNAPATATAITPLTMPPPPSQQQHAPQQHEAHRSMTQPIGLSPGALAEANYQDDDKAGIPTFRRNRMDIDSIKASMGGK